MKRRLVLALAPLVLAGCGYNQIQQYDEQAAQAKKLLLYHHDPTQSDAAVADKERRARELFPSCEAARACLTIEL